MVSIGSLWLAILLAAVLVFIASFVVWTVLPHHRSDFGKVPNEDSARAALKGIAPGQYNIPHLPSRDALKDPEQARKFEEGPVGFLTVLPSRVPGMGKQLLLWFLFLVWMGGIVAYVTTRTLPPGAEYLRVFQIAGTVAWLGFGMATISDSIWFGRPWGYSIKQLLDALLYGLLVGGVFGWLWPAAL